MKLIGWMRKAGSRRAHLFLVRDDETAGSACRSAGQPREIASVDLLNQEDGAPRCRLCGRLNPQKLG